MLRRMVRKVKNFSDYRSVGNFSLKGCSSLALGNSIFFRSEDFLTTRALKLKRRRRGSGHGPAVMQRVWHSGSNPLLAVINPLLMLRYAALY